MARSVVLVEFSPSGGLFQFAFQLGAALAERGHRVELLTGPDPELRSTVAGFSVCPVLPTWHPGEPAVNLLRRRVRRVRRAIRYLQAWWVVVRWLRRSRPDVVQWSTWRFFFDGLLAYHVARWADRPVLIDVCHAPRPFNEQRRHGGIFKRSGLLERGLRRGYRSMDAVVLLGESTRQDFRAVYTGVAHIAVVPHGDEGVFLAETDQDPGSATSTGPVCLFFGTLAAYKGIDDLLTAFPHVRRCVPDARLVIAGAASGEIDSLELRRRVDTVAGAELRLGYVPVPAVAALFRSARVVVAPYRYANASGIASLAQTFARPVVASAVGDLASVIEDGRTGLLVAPGDSDELSRAMTRLLVDPALAARLGDAGRRAIVAGGAWSLVAERLEVIYEECLATRSIRAD